MKVKVITLHADASGRFDDRAMAEFQADKEILDVSEHFYVHERTPTLTLVLSYRDVALPDDRAFPPKKDWRAELDLEAQRLYDDLRTWRGRRAKREGMPPYLILANRELAALATTRPATS